jgi:hypothetical protein
LQLYTDLILFFRIQGNPQRMEATQEGGGKRAEAAGRARA